MNALPLILPRHRRAPARLWAMLGMFLLLLLPPIAANAADTTAAPIYLDPPLPDTQLPPVELRTPQDGAAAAALYPPLREAFAAGRFADAGTLAQTAVTASIKAHGERDSRTLDARLNRAVVLLNTGDARAAGEQFTSLIDDASAISGLRAPQLETAWYGLGLCLLAAGNPTDAERAFAAALQQLRIADGLHAPEQVGYLDAMSLTARSRGRLELADGFQLRRIELAERLHGDKSPERADAAKRLADWYADTDRPKDALIAHAYRVDILSRAFGRDDPRLVPALLDEARSYAMVIDRFRERPVAIQIRSGSIVQQSEQPLNMALRIMKQHDVKLPPAERARLLIQIGDVHWIQGDRKRANSAWQLARGADTAAAQRLAQPEALEWPNDWPRQSGLDSRGLLELKFPVSDRGRVGKVEIVDQTPAGDANGQTLFADIRKALGQVRFRPAVGAAGLESRTDVRYRHVFQPSS